MESNLNSTFIVQRARDMCWKTRSCYVINDAFTYWWLIIQELIGSLSTHGSLPSGSGFLPPVSLLHLLMFCSFWPCPSFAFLSFCNNGEWAGILFFYAKTGGIVHGFDFLLWKLLCLIQFDIVFMRTYISASRTPLLFMSLSYRFVQGQISWSIILGGGEETENWLFIEIDRHLN